MILQVQGSSILLQEGRPLHEPPHVRRVVRKHKERVDLILRVDLVSTVSQNLTKPPKSFNPPTNFFLNTQEEQILQLLYV